MDSSGRKELPGLRQVVDNDLHSLVLVLQVLLGYLPDHDSLIDDAEAVGSMLQLAKDVRGYDDRHIEFVPKTFYHVAHVGNALGIQAVGGLIQYEYLGIPKYGVGYA